MKKFVSLILVLFLMLSLCGTDFAVGNKAETGSQNIIIENTSTKSLISYSESKSYDKYNVNLPSSITSKSASYSDAILELCTLDYSKSINGLNASLYTSNELSKYLDNCSDITEISKLNSIVYVCYNSLDGKSVILGYLGDVLRERSVYDESTDTCIAKELDGEYKYTDFRKGTHYEMSEELIALIDECVSKGDLDALYEIEDIKIIEDENGNIVIEPVIEPQFELNATENF